MQAMAASSKVWRNTMAITKGTYEDWQRDFLNTSRHQQDVWRSQTPYAYEAGYAGGAAKANARPAAFTPASSEESYALLQQLEDSKQALMELEQERRRKVAAQNANAGISTGLASSFYMNPPYGSSRNDPLNYIDPSAWSNTGNAIAHSTIRIPDMYSGMKTLPYLPGLGADGKKFQFMPYEPRRQLLSPDSQFTPTNSSQPDTQTDAARHAVPMSSTDGGQTSRLPNQASSINTTGQGSGSMFAKLDQMGGRALASGTAATDVGYTNGQITANDNSNSYTIYDDMALLHLQVDERKRELREQIANATTSKELENIAFMLTYNIDPYDGMEIPDSLEGTLPLSPRWLAELVLEAEEKANAIANATSAKYENPLTTMDNALTGDIELIWSEKGIQYLIQTGMYDDYFSSKAEEFPEYKNYQEASESMDFAYNMLFTAWHHRENVDEEDWPQWIKDMVSQDEAINWMYTFSKQDLLAQRKAMQYGHDTPTSETIRSDHQKWIDSIYAQYGVTDISSLPVSLQAAIKARQSSVISTLQSEVDRWQTAHDTLQSDYNDVHRFGTDSQKDEWKFRNNMTNYRLAVANAALLSFHPDFESNVLSGRENPFNLVVPNKFTRALKVSYNNPDPKSIYSLAHAMTEHEKDVYSYYLAKEGKDAAEKYFEGIRDSVEHRAAAFQKAEDEKKNPTWGLIESIPGMPIARMEALLVAGIGVLTGDDITEDDPRFGNLRRFEQYRDNFREAITKDCTPEQAQIINSLLDAGLSLTDMAAALVLGGGVQGMTVIMAAGAGGSTVYETLERGGDIRDAFTRGIAITAVSYITGKLGTGERLSSIFMNPEKIGSAWGAFVKGFVADGLEELPGWITDTLTDELVMGVQSNYNLSVRAYFDQGISLEEAEAMAAQDAAAGLLMQMLSSSFSGGIGSSVAYMAGSAKVKGRTKELQSSSPDMDASAAKYIATTEVGNNTKSGGSSSWLRDMYAWALPKTANAEGATRADRLYENGAVDTRAPSIQSATQISETHAGTTAHTAMTLEPDGNSIPSFNDSTNTQQNIHTADQATPSPGTTPAGTQGDGAGIYSNIANPSSTQDVSTAYDSDTSQNGPWQNSGMDPDTTQGSIIAYDAYEQGNTNSMPPSDYGYYLGPDGQLYPYTGSDGIDAINQMNIAQGLPPYQLEVPDPSIAADALAQLGMTTWDGASRTNGTYGVIGPDGTLDTHGTRIPHIAPEPLVFDSRIGIMERTGIDEYGLVSQ